MIRIAASQANLQDGRTRVVLDLDSDGVRFLDMIVGAWDGRKLMRVTEHISHTLLDTIGLSLREEVERSLHAKLQRRLAERGMTALVVSRVHRHELTSVNQVMYSLAALCVPMASTRDSVAGVVGSEGAGSLSASPWDPR